MRAFAWHLKNYRYCILLCVCMCVRVYTRVAVREQPRGLGSVFPAGGATLLGRVTFWLVAVRSAGFQGTLSLFFCPVVLSLGGSGF